MKRIAFIVALILCTVGVAVALAGPPGGGQTAFCCLHPNGTPWHTGEKNPATGAVMATQAQINAACNTGQLRPGTRVACVSWMAEPGRPRRWR